MNESEVDGMDLSHLLKGETGPERDHIFMAYKDMFFLRNQYFRVDEQGQLFHSYLIPPFVIVKKSALSRI